MKIEIQNWWGAKIYTNKGASGLTKAGLAEETLRSSGKICIYAIIIDGKIVGEVVWDGKELSISKELAKLK